jgi:hypothetical protein
MRSLILERTARQWIFTHYLVIDLHVQNVGQILTFTYIGW